MRAVNTWKICGMSDTYKSTDTTQKAMSEKLFDALDNLGEDDSNENSDGDASAQNVNDALGEDARYWKSRNQTKKIQDVIRDDEDED